MIAAARRAAFDALTNVAEHGTDLGEAVARVRRSLADDRDCSLVLELVAGTLRMQAAIDYQLARRVSRPLPRLDAAVLRTLRLGAFQLLYLDRIPAPAVIDDAVELTRRARRSSAAGLVNAVLRALGRDRDRVTWPKRPAKVESAEDRASLIRHLATVHSHPEWLVERWLARHGLGQTESWLIFNNRRPALCLAPNLAVTSRDKLARELAGDGVQTTHTQVARDGLVVSSGQALKSRAFLDGRFLVQDEASQLIAELVRAEPGSRVLDLCASPGGKTVRFVAGVGDHGMVIACDVRPHRLDVLRKTLTRCNADRVRVVYIPPASALPFRAGAFDEVFIDAPCSGLGTIRRDPDIRWKRTPADVAAFASTQRGLLARSADLIRPNGRLIYSTCSSEPEENEEVVQQFLIERPDFTLAHVHQTWPFRDQLEAFYGAVLIRANAS
jgi:16S rRNA (cytosine967-C5)-methyltransferase